MKTEDLLFALNGADEREIDAAKNGRRVQMTPKRAVALAAALAVLLLCVFPVAAAPVSKPAYELLYAVAPSLAQKMKPVQLSDVKEGIQMEVVSAEIKGDTAVMLVAFKDLEGDRIDGTTDLFDSYMVRTPYDTSGTCRMESYDPGTGVAVYTVMQQNMGGKAYEGDKVTFSVRELLLNKQNYDDLPLPLSLASVTRTPELREVSDDDYRGGSYADMPGVEDRISENTMRQLGRVLAADPAQEQTLTEGVTLTAAGYTGGHLRVQLRFTDILSTDNHGFLWLENAEGDRIEPVLSESFWTPGHRNSGRGNNDSLEEYLFEIPEEALTAYTVHGDFTTSHGPLVGNWEITFPLNEP